MNREEAKQAKDAKRESIGLIPSTFATSHFFAPSRFPAELTVVRVFQRPKGK